MISIILANWIVHKWSKISENILNSCNMQNMQEDWRSMPQAVDGLFNLLEKVSRVTYISIDVPMFCKFLSIYCCHISTFHLSCAWLVRQLNYLNIFNPHEFGFKIFSWSVWWNEMNCQSPPPIPAPYSMALAVIYFNPNYLFFRWVMWKLPPNKT